MKTLILSFTALILAMPFYAQEDTIVNEGDLPEKTKRSEKTSISISDDEIISVDENNDTTRIKIGKKGISIVETPGGTKIDIHDLDAPEKNAGPEKDEKDKISKPKKFKGHWAGFQIGLNNYLNSNFSTSLDNTMDFMDLNTGKSWTYSINFMEHSFGFGTDRAGIVTGLGLEWSNYHFDRDFSIQKDSTGSIISYPLSFLGGIVKNKLQTTYLTVPLLLEFQIPTGKKRIYFNVGPVGSVKLGSHTKIIYKDAGDKKKIKERDDFSLSPFRYGITARAGYNGMNLFATCYLSSLFEANKGPELYPFSIGLTLISF